MMMKKSFREENRSADNILLNVWFFIENPDFLSEKTLPPTSVFFLSLLIILTEGPGMLSRT